MHNHTHLISKDEKLHSKIIYVRFLIGADCDSNHYLVDVIFRRGLSVSKQAAQKFNMEGSNLNKLNVVDISEILNSI